MKEDDEEEVLPTYLYLHISISMLCMYVILSMLPYNNILLYIYMKNGDIHSVPTTLVTCKSLHSKKSLNYQNT